MTLNNPLTMREALLLAYEIDKPNTATQEAVKVLANALLCLPRDRDGTPIIPGETYETTDGLKCVARVFVTFGVSVRQGDRFRECTTQDVTRIEP